MFHDILCEGDRKVLCDYLLEHATDDTLLRVADETKEHHQFIRSELDSIKKFIGVSKFFFNTPVTTPVKPVEPTDTQQIVIELPEVKVNLTEYLTPPGVASKRIGSSTLEQITRRLQASPATIDQLSLHLKSSVPNTQAALKLLWSRGLLAYNGSEYLLIPSK